MPHFVAKTLSSVTYPKQYEEITYDYEALSDRERLIHISYPITQTGGQSENTPSKNSFFLNRQSNKEGAVVVKVDKYTRPPDIKIIQKALIGYAQLSNADITHQNIYTKKNANSSLQSLYAIKDIAFFIDLFKTTPIDNCDKVFCLEIGFGSGRHLLDKARKNPDAIFIGLEIHKPSLEQVSKLAQIEKLDNLFLGFFDARLFLEILPSNLMRAIYIHFPVPWDKKPHRRIYSIPFLQEARRVLSRDGSLELRTDSDAYYAYVLELCESYDWQPLIKKNEPSSVSSKYEERWKKLEKNIYDVILINRSPITTTNSSLHFDFSFDGVIFDKNVVFDTNPKIYEDFFIHIQNDFDILSKSFQNGRLLKIAFGHFDKLEHNYIVIENGHLYYEKRPIPSSINQKAHIELCHILSKGA